MHIYIHKQITHVYTVYIYIYTYYITYIRLYHMYNYYVTVWVPSLFRNSIVDSCAH